MILMQLQDSMIKQEHIILKIHKRVKTWKASLQACSHLSKSSKWKKRQFRYPAFATKQKQNQQEQCSQFMRLRQQKRSIIQEVDFIIFIKNIIQKLYQMQQQSPSIAKDLRTYDYVLQKLHLQFTQIRPLSASNSLLTHILFKVIAIMLFYFEQIFNELLSKLVTAQLCIVFVVIDFWFTKNVNGRRLIGLRWFFAEDEYGTQRFMFEARLNDQYVNNVNSKIFWLMQLMYIVVSVIDMITTIIMVPNIYLIQFEKIVLNIIVITGGFSNMFLFFQAYSASSRKILEFKARVGHEVIRKLGPNSLVSFL